MWSVDYIPRGTRFGPVTGEVLWDVPRNEDSPRKHHWKVSSHHHPVAPADIKHSRKIFHLSIK